MTHLFKIHIGAEMVEIVKKRVNELIAKLLGNNGQRMNLGRRK
jgi:hypothetical protein